MKNLGQTRWILGTCAVLVGCGGAAPGPLTAAQPRAEAKKPAASIALPASENPSPASAPVFAPPPDSPKGEPLPALAVFPELAESPGAAEVEPGAALVRKGQWIAAQVQFSKLLPVFDSSGPVDAILAAHVLYGRSCAKMGDIRCAEREHNRAVAIWESPGTAAALQGDTGASGRERLARALSAVGEALHSLAEQKHAALNKFYMPAYKGEATKEGITQFVQTKVTDWIKQKSALVEETEKAYAKIFDLKPAPPPRWAVAAAARSAFSWGRFSAELRAAPIPQEWKHQGKVAGSEFTGPEIRKFYYESLDQVAAPLKDRARAMFEQCRDTSDRTQHQDEFSRSCVAWLEKTAALPR